jgi:hypothetical protein
MKSQWNFYFESKGFRFDRTHKYEGEIGAEQAEAFGFPPENFTFQMIIEPDEKPRFDWMQQTGTLKVILPGDMDQTKDLAHWIAVHSSEQVSFSNGELKLLGGLITGEYLPETPEEEKQLGENRYFATVHLVEAVPPDTFDGSSLQNIAGSSAIGVVIRQYNAALKANNPIDKFLGLFRIIEDFYGPKSKKKILAEALKESTELQAIAQQHLKFSEEDNLRELEDGDYFKLVDDLVRIRHNCAHLRTSKGFGIPHGDRRVKDEIEPLIEPLRVLAFEAIHLKMDTDEES